MSHLESAFDSGRAGAVLSLTLALATLQSIGCGSASEVHEVGHAQLELQLPHGAGLSVLKYIIEQHGKKVSEGTVPVDESDIVSFQVGKLLAGAHYKLKLLAKAANGDPCSCGRNEFDIDAGETTQISSKVRCGEGEPDVAGNARVNATVVIEDCVAVDGVSALPASAKLGGSISLRGWSTSSHADYAWTVSPASGGSFSADDRDETEFKCEQAGDHTITLQVSGDGSCETGDTASVVVTCGSASPSTDPSS